MTQFESRTTKVPASDPPIIPFNFIRLRPYFTSLVFLPVSLPCMEETAQGSSQVSVTANPQKRRNRIRYRSQNSTPNGNQSGSASVPSNHTHSAGSEGGRRGPSGDHAIRKPRRRVTNSQADGTSVSQDSTVAVDDVLGGALSSNAHNSQRRNPSKQTGDSVSTSVPEARNRGPQVNRRGAKFNAGLTESSTEVAPASNFTGQSNKHKVSPPKGDDLTSTLIRVLSTPPYPDCPICFAVIYPAQPTWSCNPTHTTKALDDDTKEKEGLQCCWTKSALLCFVSSGAPAHSYCFLPAASI